MENTETVNRNKRTNAKEVLDFLSMQNLSESAVVLKTMMEKFSMSYANAYYFFRKVRKSHKDIVQG